MTDHSLDMATCEEVQRAFAHACGDEQKVSVSNNMSAAMAVHDIWHSTKSNTNLDFGPSGGRPRSRGRKLKAPINPTYPSLERDELNAANIH